MTKYEAQGIGNLEPQSSFTLKMDGIEYRFALGSTPMIDPAELDDTCVMVIESVWDSKTNGRVSVYINKAKGMVVKVEEGN